MPEQQQEKIGIPEIIARIGDVNARLRITEEKLGQLKEKVGVVDHTMIKHKKDFQEEQIEMNLKISEVSKELDEIKTAIRQLVKQMQAFAPKRDVKVIQRFVELFDPTSIMTKEDVEAIIEKKLSERER